MSLRRALPWSVALVLSFVTIVSAAPSATKVSQSEPVLYSSEPLDAASLICLSVRCAAESDCWAACPSASSVSCTNNACRYTYPGGGGGSGGGGPTCPLTRCIDDSDSVCSGRRGYCDGRACRY